LEVLVTATVRESARKCWSRETALIRAQAKDAYYRELTLDKRINYIHEYLLAKVWYLTQIYPTSTEHINVVVHMEGTNIPDPHVNLA